MFFCGHITSGVYIHYRISIYLEENLYFLLISNTDLNINL